MPKRQERRVTKDGVVLIRCPRCKLEKVWDPLTKGGEWYGRQRHPVREWTDEDGEDWVTPTSLPEMMPSPYCRKCTTLVRKERRHRDKALAQLATISPEEAAEMRAREWGACTSCGNHTANRWWLKSHDAYLCQLCRECFDKCGADVKVARQHWMALFMHLSDEAKLDREWEARQGDGRRRKWHHGNPEVGLDSPHHATCLMMEKQWRATMNWLAKVEQEANDDATVANVLQFPTPIP